jgi:hypothetical protein
MRQNAQADWLIQEIRCADTVSAFDGLLILPSGDNEDGRFPIGFLRPDRFADRKSVQLRHFNIKENDIGLRFGKLFQRNLAVNCENHTEAGFLQGALQHPAVSTVVVGYQYERLICSVCEPIHVCAAASCLPLAKLPAGGRFLSREVKAL